MVTDSFFREEIVLVHIMQDENGPGLKTVGNEEAAVDVTTPEVTL